MQNKSLLICALVTASFRTLKLAQAFQLIALQVYFTAIIKGSVSVKYTFDKCYI